MNASNQNFMYEQCIYMYMNLRMNMNMYMSNPSTTP